MTKLFIYDDSDNIINISEEIDEEFFDFMVEMVDAYEEDNLWDWLLNWFVEQNEDKMPEITKLREL
jgi:hypothetical protein